MSTAGQSLPLLVSTDTMSLFDQEVVKRKGMQMGCEKGQLAEGVTKGWWARVGNAGCWLKGGGIRN